MIGITGATSAIGRAVVAAFEAQAVPFVRLGRSVGTAGRYYDVGCDIPADMLEGLTALVHLAWDWDAGHDVNARAGTVLVEACARRDIRPVLLSTFSAFAAPVSRYGAEKLAVEQRVVAAGGVAFRAGLVWGDSPAGILARLVRIAKVPGAALRLVPDTAMYHTAAPTLVECLVESAIASNTDGVHLAASRESVPLSKLLATLRGARSGMPVPVPVRSMASIARVAERLRIPLPFRADSFSALGPRVEERVRSVDLPWVEGFPGQSTFLEWANAAAA